jgi:hypothetical protein
VKGDRDGYRLSSGTTGTWPRVALSMMMAKNTSVRKIYKEYETKVDKKIAPKTVNKG